MSTLKNVGELSNLLKKLPQGMKIGLLDMGSDDPYDTNYSVQTELLEYTDEPEGDIVPDKKMLFFTFTNKRVEDWMNDDRGRLEHDLEMIENKISRLSKIHNDPKNQGKSIIAWTARQKLLEGMTAWKAVLDNQLEEPEWS